MKFSFSQEWRRSFLLTGTCLLFTLLSYAQPTFITGFSKTLVGSGWSEPVGTAFTKDGTKMFVYQKGGQVYVCNWNSSTKTYVKQSTAVLNIGPEVGNWRDHGMLGFALDPNYQTNGLFYVLYVVDRHYLINFGTGSYSSTTDDYFKATIGRITRYRTITSGGNLIADVSSRTILLGESKTTGIPILHESHGIGALAFATDGTLLASAGDAASYNTTDSGSLAETYYSQALADGIIRSNENVGSFRSQMVNCLDGKILRIDPVNGNGVSSNPFYQSSSPRSARSRVWTMGLRNPFRFSIKPNTGGTNPASADVGDIYIGEVGWDKYEELNIIRQPAMNCGWPLFEGLTPQSSYSACNTYNKDETNPLYNGGSCNQQWFRFRNLLKQATKDNSYKVYNPCNSSTVINGGHNNRTVHRIPVLDWKHGVDSSRVAIWPTNNLAVSQIGSASSGVTGKPFNGNCATGGFFYTGTKYPVKYQNTFFMGDLGGQWMKAVTIQYNDKVIRVDSVGWDFGAIVHINWSPADSNMYYIDMGDNSVNVLKYGGNLPPVVKMGSNKIYGPSPLAVNFNSTGSNDPEGSAVTYAWNFDDPASGSSNTSTSANPSHTFTVTGVKKYVVKLTVKDAANNTTTDSLVISANNTPPVVNVTSPVKNSKYNLGSDTAYTLAATVTDAQHSGFNLKYEWQASLRHNVHQHNEPVDTNRNTSKIVSRIGCNIDAYYWHFQLKVTDAGGLFTIDSSNIYPNCGGTLPVVLSFFGVKKNVNLNIVTWITESEINLKYFEVQRSNDGMNFIAVDRVNATRPQGRGYYQLQDPDYLPGYNYYRLKMVDMDGSFNYSMTIRVTNDMPDDLSLGIAPNPSKEYFMMSSSFSMAGKINANISDMSGKIVRRWTEQAIKGFNSFRVANIGNIPPGLYVVSVEQNGELRKAKLIIAK